MKMPLKTFLIITFLTCCLNTAVESVPVSVRMLDMSYTYDNSTLFWPTTKRFEFKLIVNETVNNSYWLQLEELETSTHAGTHLDAPCHFVPGRWSVEEIPLNRLIAPAAVVDITQKAKADPNAEIEIEDLYRWENETGHLLNDVILMLRSGWGKRWPNRIQYFGTVGNDTKEFHFPGVSPKAAEWLVNNRNVYGIGTDSPSIDHGQSQDFKTHQIVEDKNIFSLENVANMEELPIYGATLYVMPMKIGRASGAPCRIIASIPEVVFGQKTDDSEKEKTLHEVILFSK